MAKNYKAAILITGDNTGGVKAIKATRQQIDGLNKSVDKSGKSFKSYTSRTNASTKALNSLKEQAKLAAGAVGLGLLVDRAAKAADTMTQLNARLELATDTTAQFQEAQSRLIEISRNTYTAIDTNVTLFARMSIATKDLAIDQETLFKATESLQNSFRAYGTSTEEAASATLQLTQAMAKGKLDGDEFRSVMENAPLVMTALTKELNITKKELFEFSRTGRLQVQDLVAALANSADEFAAQSAKIPQTISEAFTGLNREFTLMVGNADDAISASTLITKSINLLANNLELLVTGVGLRLLAPMIGQIGATAALTTKSIGLFGTGLVTLNARAALATKTMAGLNKAMALVGGPAGLALLGGYAAWTGINALIDERNDKLDQLSKLSGTAAHAIDNFKNSMSGSDDEAQSLRTMANEIENLKNKLAELNKEQAKNFAGAEFGAGRMIGGPATQNTQDEINALRNQKDMLEAIAFLGPKLKPVWEGINNIADARAKSAQAAADEKAALEQQIESVDKWITSQQEQLISLQKQNEYFGKSAELVLLLEAAKQKLLTTDEKQRKKIDSLTAAVIKETKALEEKEKALAAQNEAIELAMDLNKEYATDAEQLAQIESARIEAIDLLTDNHEALAAAGIDLSKVIDKVNKRAKEQVTAVQGANDMWDEYYQLMQDLGMIDEVAFEFTQMEMALEELAMSGQFSQAQLDALREAMYRYREAAEAGTQAQVEFNRSIRGVNADGGFTSDASFNDLINQGMTLGDVLSEAGKGFSQGLEGGLNSMNVLLQGVETIMGVWDSTAGQDSLGRVTNTAADLAASGMFGPIAQAVGQIAQTINSLTGGRLFGTSFETESQRTNIELGQGGFSGTNTLREVRQRSWFRGREWQDTVTAIGADMQASLDAFYDEILQVRQAGADALGVTLNTPIVTGSYVEEYDADGNLTRQGSTFGGRFFNEDSQAFQVRAMAENIIDLLGSAFEPIEREVTRLEPVYDDYGRLIGSFSRTMTIMVNEADQLANRWRHDAQMFLDGSQMLLAAGADILDGNGLFESLTAVANVIQDMAKPGESLTDAYMRVQSSVLLLDDALDVIGASFDMARVDYVRFAADITDAAGGIQEAAGLWQNYFENFYTEPELNEIRLGQSSDLLAQQAGNLGLDADMTMAEFRQLFNEQMPNLTAEQIAQWLEFAETLVRVNDLQEERNAALQAELEALQAYNDFAGSITDQIAELTGNGASEFENRIAEIDSGLQSNIDSLYELAAAAGLAEPAQEDLSNAYRLAALQTAEAIGLLRDATQSLIDELYGDQAQSQVDQFSNSFQSGISNVSQAGSNLFSQWESALQRIDDYTNSLLTNEQLSPLEAPERLAQARADFYDLVAAANAGDVEAAAQVQPAMQEFLQILRDVERSGEDYNSEFYAAIAAAQGITAPTGGGESVTVGPSQAYIDYTNQQRQEDAAAMAAHRLELSQALAEHVSQLAQAINQPVLQLFTDMGGDIEQFLVDLGIDVGEATGETTAMLANLAETLNIEVTELADHVGLSLGSLADAQSLLNDGLEFTINSLPDGIQNTLEPLLRDVENAADGTQQEAALAALETATAGLPAEYRNALAPYFDNIDPTSELAQQVTELQDQTRWLTAIAKNTAAQNDAAGLPSYDVGTPFVPKDQIAQIHKGEMIIPAREAGILRGMGVNVAPQSNADVVAELREVKAELKSMKAMQRGKFDESITVQGQIRDEAGKDRNPPTPIQPRQIKGVCSG